MDLKPAALCAEDLVFRYGGLTVVDGVSLTIRDGEILGVIGPNGSGKSTLLKLLGGVLTPQGGRVVLRDALETELTRAQIARRIAMVPQDSYVPFPFTVAEIVLMGRAPHLRPFALEGERDRGVAAAAMARLGITELAGRTIQELSGGERQRVMFARALAQEASILLLDEPAAFLDLRHQMAVYETLAELRGEGRAVATVLHDLNLAALYCDQIAVLKQGRLVALGSPRDVISAAMIETVFETRCRVEDDPTSGMRTVLPRR